MAMAVVLDHDYCAPVIGKESDSREQAEFVPNANSSSEGNPLHVQVVNTSADAPVSSPSPPHSCDSGMDNEFDALLADLGVQKDYFLDIDDLDRLLDGEKTTSEETSSQTGKSRTSQNAEKAARSSNDVNMEEEEKWWLGRSRKNAIYARENRQRKKKYVNGLEAEVSELKKENQELKKEAEEMHLKVSKLEEELAYTRNVLANESTIALLIKSVAATPGISLSSSLVSRSRRQDPEQNGTESSTQHTKYATRSRKRVGDVESLDDSRKRKRVGGGGGGGVCLHVSQEQVSLELCSQCSAKAQRSGRK